MPNCPEYIPELEPLKILLLDVAQERTVEGVLKLIVERLAKQADVALARIWLIQPGDICKNCRMRDDCPDQTRCLHLVASAGAPLNDSQQQWNRLTGDFMRFPLGVRKVGRIASTGNPIAVFDVAKDDSWMARPEWIKQENIRGFGGQPLVYQGQVLGVLAVFARATMCPETMQWLRMLADHAAASIANARAFEEIDRLRHLIEQENEYLRAEVVESKAFGSIVGQSSAIRNLVQQIELLAPTDANALILGESGTGKELVAWEIHQRSARNHKPLIKVNCASIPRELYESEFFGHVQGAFTGAIRDRAGRFELADGGTLFLDEVGEIPIELQSKLLRVIQEGQFERVGDERTRQADVRLIAATNRDLKAEVDAGNFRQDLYYRLNVFPIGVAPLRDRAEDIPALAEHFLQQSARKLNRSMPELSMASIIRLQEYQWPGNIRELQNVLERSLIVSTGKRLKIDLPAQPTASPKEQRGTPIEVLDQVVPDYEIRRIERDNIARALQQTNGKVYGENGAAELLEMKPTTLVSRIKKYGIKRQDG